jgi:hypothetical protein
MLGISATRAKQIHAKATQADRLLKAWHDLCYQPKTTGPNQKTDRPNMKFLAKKCPKPRSKSASRVYNSRILRLPALKLLSTILFAYPASATVYYVDVETGDNAKAGTSISSAWKHLPQTVGQTGSGWATLVDGDTVFVKGGTTNLCQVALTTSNYKGSSGKFDSIKLVSGHLNSPPWGTGRAIFDEQNTRTYGFFVGDNTQTTGITFDGFEIRNIKAGGPGGSMGSTGSACFDIGGNGRPQYTKIRRCWLHDALRTVNNTGTGINVTSADYFCAEYNEIGPAIGTKGMDITDCHHGVLKQNYVHATGDHGISCDGTNWDICGNLIYMTPANGSAYAHGPVFALKVYQGFYDIWNNVCFSDGTNEYSSGIGLFAGSGNDRVVHNTTYRFLYSNEDHERGVGIAVGCEDNSLTNCLIQSNICISNKNYCPSGGSAFYMHKSCSNVTVRLNNLFWKASNDSVAGIRTNVYDHYYSTGQFDTAGSDWNCSFVGNTQLNPTWVGGNLPTGLDSNGHPNTAYFALSDSSPSSLRTGIPLYGDGIHGYSSDPNKFLADILGTVRKSWSLGAYEYVPPTSALTAPSGLRIVAMTPQ